MSTMPIMLRTANRDHKGEIDVDPAIAVQDILDAAQENWALPANYEYIVRCERLQRQLQPTETLVSAGVQANDVLEIQQISDAGRA